MSMIDNLGYYQLLEKYRKYEGDWTKCVYCGRDSEAEDHVLPTSVAKMLPYFKWPEEILLIVPCCKQCNSIAGSDLFMKFQSKVTHIRHKLKLRASKLYFNELCLRLGLTEVEGNEDGFSP